MFLVGFFLSVYFWFARDTGNKSIPDFVVYLLHNRRELFRKLFEDGPGYLILPLWLVFASVTEKYLGPVLRGLLS